MQCNRDEGEGKEYSDAAAFIFIQRQKPLFASLLFPVAIGVHSLSFRKPNLLEIKAEFIFPLR